MSNVDHLCLGCIRDKVGDGPCPYCGFDPSAALPANCLPVKTLLQQRYAVGKRLDQNGEGIGYIGYDTEADTAVYIREFLPENMAERSPAGTAVKVITGCETSYSEYKQAFLNYFRSVARMRELSALLPIYDIFEENNTAYVISEWADNITLREFVERSGGKVEWNVARPLFMPVLSSLSSMQAAGVRHFGICPDNLVILRSGKMKLRGFSIRSVRQMDTDLAPELFSGCAAIEQYTRGYPLEETTDVYGFTASLFYALTGILPEDALKRRNDGRLMIPTSILRVIPPHVVTALANGLQVNPEKRTPTFERLRAELSAAPTVTMVQEEVAAPPRPTPAQKKNAAKPSKRAGGLPNFVWGILSCVVAFIIFSAVIFLLYGKDGLMGMGTPQTSVSSEQEDSLLTSVPESSLLPETEQVNIPVLVGKKFEEVKQEADNSKEYKVIASEERFDDEIAEGYIISQTPDLSSGQTMEKGTVVVVVVSKGSEMRTLPSIKGSTITEASAAVTAQGFVPTRGEDVYSSEVPSGRVVGYGAGYEEGQELQYGTEVEILISKGADPHSGAAGEPQE